MITDSASAVTDRASYGLYGELLSRTGTTDTPFLFNGKWGVQTDASGIYYHRARYYHPALRRFLNQDTVLGSISTAASLNRFAYANGNPVTAIDPFGLAPKDAAPTSGMTLGKMRFLRALVNVAYPSFLASMGIINKALAVGEMTGSVSAGINAAINPVYGFLEGAYENVTARSLNPDTPQAQLGFWQQVLSGVSAELNAASAVGIGSLGAKALAAETDMVNLASPQRTIHILEGDATGGGHMFPGLPGKTVFPEGWSGPKIMNAGHQQESGFVVCDLNSQPFIRTASGAFCLAETLRLVSTELPSADDQPVNPSDGNLRSPRRVGDIDGNSPLRPDSVELPQDWLIAACQNVKILVRTRRPGPRTAERAALAPSASQISPLVQHCRDLCALISANLNIFIALHPVGIR